MVEHVDTVVVGAGQAGLTVSHLLTQSQVEHVVYERGRIGESWRSQRWDTFTLNTPNWANVLPGATSGVLCGGPDPDGFAPRDELVASLEAYVTTSSAPIMQQCDVTSVTRAGEGRFVINTAAGRTESRNVVVCSGAQSEPVLPGMATQVPDSIQTQSAATYRNPGALSDGAVVVVGSAQSGCQITEDLLEAGRKVYLCVSSVGRLPRRYRGCDTVRWMADVGMLDARPEDLRDPAARYAAQPQVSGTDGGHTVSLQSLARDGATLLGRAEGFDGMTLRLRPTVADAVAFADAKRAEVTAAIDTFIASHGIDAPLAEPDSGEPDLPDLGGSDSLEALGLAAAGVSTIIWCTGFAGDFSWLPPDLLEDDGLPRHHDGVSDVAGLYAVGFPWLSSRKSGLLYGIADDAGRVVEHLTARTPA